MNSKLVDAVRGAVAEMFQSVLASPVHFSAAEEIEASSRPYETSVVISFVGSISGAFALRCSQEAAARIASVMLGSEIAKDSDEMKDAIGEFFNMVVGVAKTRYSENGESFKVSMPTTVVGSSYVLHIKSNESEKLTLLDFAYDAYTLSIEVYLK